MNDTCPHCNSELLGDGYTDPIHCEFVENVPLGTEPDAEPVYCNVRIITIP